MRGCLTDGVGPVADPVGGGLCGEAPPRERLALGGTRRQRLLGLTAPLRHRRELLLESYPRRAGRVGGLRRIGELHAARPERVAGELPLDLERLAVQPLVQFGGLRLAFQRSQARPRLTLDIERAVEVVLGVAELQLGATAALAMLAEARGLLDQEPAVTRFGGDDRLDPALGDDGMHLLAETGVGQDLEHVDRRHLAPASRYSPSPSRSRRRKIETSGPMPEPALAVVEHQLDLGAGAAWRPGAPPKITSCIDWPRTATGDCSPSAHSTASVTFDLPEPLGPTITLVPGPNSSRRAIGERFESLQRDALQIHD